MNFTRDLANRSFFVSFQIYQNGQSSAIGESFQYFLRVPHIFHAFLIPQNLGPFHLFYHSRELDRRRDGKFPKTVFLSFHIFSAPIYRNHTSRIGRCQASVKNKRMPAFLRNRSVTSSRRDFCNILPSLFRKIPKSGLRAMAAVPRRRSRRFFSPLLTSQSFRWFLCQ